MARRASTAKVKRKAGPTARRAAARPATPTVRRKAKAARTTARPEGLKPAAAGLGETAIKLAGVGSEAVKRATGRAWDEWLKVLDRAGASTLPHKEIASMLSSRFSVPGWWSQMLTVGYEQARGMRARHQAASGHSASASRTVGADLDKLYAAWSEPAQRSRWLPGAPVEVRRSTDGKSMRMTWTSGGSSVDVNFHAKGPGKAQVQVQHGKLPDAEAATRQKAYWGDALARLKALLEKPR